MNSVQLRMDNVFAMRIVGRENLTEYRELGQSTAERLGRSHQSTRRMRTTGIVAVRAIYVLGHKFPPVPPLSPSLRGSSNK